MTEKIVFFGSSLNPPTIAHVAMVKALIEYYEDDPNVTIMIAPVFQHIASKKYLNK